MRVELPHDVADHAGALGERLVGTVTTVEHRVDHATVDGLQSVTHLGQRAPDDHAHRVIEVRTLHLLLQIDLVDPAVDAEALAGGGLVRHSALFS